MKLQFSHITVKRILRRGFAGRPSDSSCDDQQLLHAFRTIKFRPLQTLAAILSNHNEMNFFVKMIYLNLFPRMRSIYSLKIYAELQHPLLKKYGFDVMDFAEGAKQAFHSITTAAYSDQYIKYCSGKEQASDHHTFLSSVVTKNMLERIKTEVLHTQKTTIGGTVIESKLSSNQLLFLNIVRIEVDIVENTHSKSNCNEADIRNSDKASSASNSDTIEAIKGQELDVESSAANPRGQETNKEPFSDISNSSTSSSSARQCIVRESSSAKSQASKYHGEKNNTDNTSDQQYFEYLSHAKMRCDEFVEYPIGSIVAKVYVLYKGRPWVNMIVGNQVYVTVSEPSKYICWSFTGCISGHVELDWKVDLANLAPSATVFLRSLDSDM